MNHLQFQASIGTIAITWNSLGKLTSVDWFGDCGVPGDAWSSIGRWQIPPVVSDLVERLRGYFERGEPMGEVPWEHIEQSTWTDFQKQVYGAITQIPHGETRTYSWVACRIANYTLTRAVGQALRKNPLPILIPCHRVVSATTLGGFMGSTDPHLPELQLKQKLITLEEGYISPMFSFLTTAPHGNPSLTPGLTASSF